MLLLGVDKIDVPYRNGTIFAFFSDIEYNKTKSLKIITVFNGCNIDFRGDKYFICSTRRKHISIKDAVKVFLLTSTRLMV